MNCKKILSLSFLIAAFSTLNAQVGVAYLNPTFQQIGSKSFSAFAESYRTLNSSNLKSFSISQPG
ncbi:MAG: hypothetical protein ACRC3B_02375, partial [Bacteroidia bacterium]